MEISVSGPGVVTTKTDQVVFFTSIFERLPYLLLPYVVLHRDFKEPILEPLRNNGPHNIKCQYSPTLPVYSSGGVVGRLLSCRHNGTLPKRTRVWVQESEDPFKTERPTGMRRVEVSSQTEKEVEDLPDSETRKDLLRGQGWFRIHTVDPGTENGPPWGLLKEDKSGGTGTPGPGSPTP